MSALRPRPAAPLLALLLALAASGCASAPPAAPPAAAGGPHAPARGTVVRERVRSAALEGNLLGDPAEQELRVYLPPGYAQGGATRYPVLYFLHGFGGSAGEWTDGKEPARTLQHTLDTLIAEGTLQPLIVVLPNGHNRYGGSFWQDSPVAGGWETYVARDVVAHVDRTYRTLAQPQSRGVAGHSMGGFGALTLAMRHADVFGSAWAMSPCCLALEADLGPDNPAWVRIPGYDGAQALEEAAGAGDFYPLLLTARAAAFSPDADAAPLRVALPFALEGGRVRPKAPAYGRWREALPLARAREAAGALRSLQALGFDAGTRDEFGHVPLGARALSAELARLDVPHTFELFDGDHNGQVPLRLRTRVLPFFSRVLARETAAPASVGVPATRGP